jgi:hypothetical protein
MYCLTNDWALLLANKQKRRHEIAFRIFKALNLVLREHTWYSASELAVEILLRLPRGTSLASPTLSVALDLHLSAAFSRLEDLTARIILVSCMNRA